MCTKIKSKGHIYVPNSMVSVRTSVGFKNLRWGIPIGQNLVANARIERLRDFWKPVIEDFCFLEAEEFYEKGKIFIPKNPLLGINTKDSFAIITTEANEQVKPVHNRMPFQMNPDKLERFKSIIFST